MPGTYRFARLLNGLLVRSRVLGFMNYRKFQISWFTSTSRFSTLFQGESNRHGPREQRPNHIRNQRTCQPPECVPYRSKHRNSAHKPTTGLRDSWKIRAYTHCLRFRESTTVGNHPVKHRSDWRQRTTSLHRTRVCHRRNLLVPYHWRTKTGCPYYIRDSWWSGQKTELSTSLQFVISR